MPFDFRNTNTLWASVLVETLVRLGLRTAIVSPGSRSTPLTLALANHPQMNAVPILDERSAAFWGLGVAKRTGCPVVLVCTSGTAGANYYPAIIEAKESQVPLLVLTADRPPELRDCASGQTIDQQKLFGHFPNWYAELATPLADVTMLRYLRQTIVQAWHQSLRPTPGPVHLNCPFRDPLAPVSDGSVNALESLLDENFFAGVVPLNAAPSAQSSPPKNWGAFSPSTMTAADLNPGRIQPWLETWQQCREGLIVAGPAQPLEPEGYCRAVAALSHHLNWPVLAEGLSPLRNFAEMNPHLVSTYDAILRQPRWSQDLVAKHIIQIGPLPTSKVLRQWLENTDPHRWVLDASTRNLDPLHGSTTHLPISLAQLIAYLPQTPEPSDQSQSNYLAAWLNLEQKVRDHLDTVLAGMDDLFAGKVPWMMAQHLPPGTPVMIANSLPIRDVEWFWPPGKRHIRPFCNRGANGIDGTLSTALGIAHRGLPTVLLTGDLALLHDTNGWLSLPQLQGHLTVIVINNHGGGIFEMLPIAKFDPPFEDFFATPQTVNFNHLCAAYGVNYERVESWQQLQACLSFLPEQGVRVLEVRTDSPAGSISGPRKQSHQLRQNLLDLKDLLP
jgi:2-succinyl-5-enolpyruvyl-6-hydroxy-3-cyclohexene-1-carboxylate synthase